MEEESRKSFAQITLYNQLIKEMDDLYRVYAKNCNLSETAFWILYCIQERKKRRLPRGRSATIGSTRPRQ